MARHPKSVWRPIPEESSQPKIGPTQIILHTAVDGINTSTLYGWWNSPGNNLEAHFYARSAKAGGGGEQYLDTTTRADANAQANSRAVSIEAWDGQHDYKSYQLYQPGQIDYLVELIDWLCRTHDIPRVLCPAWNAPGIGWHKMYAQWSPGGNISTGCPGNPRITQIRNIILPRVQALGANQPASPTEEDDDMKAVILVDPRDGAQWLCFGNTRTHLQNMEQVNVMKFLGVQQVDNADINWIDAHAINPR